MAKDKVNVPSIQIGLNRPGFAFGGVIYSAAATVGYGGSPTELSINVALDTKTGQTFPDANAKSFNVNKNDLDLTSPISIKFSGVPFFMNMFLTGYEISTDVENKTLSAKYFDGSVLLDRIFVGLIHEHFEINPRKHSINNLIELKVKCPKRVKHEVNNGVYYVCSSEEGEILTRRTYRRLANPTGDPRRNFLAIRQSGRNIWQGGYIVLGKEEFSGATCDIRDVSYSFRDLIYAIKSFGINVDMSRYPDRPNQDNLTKNYTGTLKDVLQSWGNDLGITFFWNFSAAKPTISIVNLSDRSIQYKFEAAINGIDGLDRGHGSDMISGSDLVINSKNYSTDLDGTYTQAFSSVMTRGPGAKSKTRKTSEQVLFTCQTLKALSKAGEWIMKRKKDDFFTSMVLGKYAPGLRDPYNVRKAINAHGGKKILIEEEPGDKGTSGSSGTAGVTADPSAAGRNNSEGYWRALGFRDVIGLTFGDVFTSTDPNIKKVLAEFAACVALPTALDKSFAQLDLHYAKDYGLGLTPGPKPTDMLDFHVFIGIYDESLKAEVSKTEQAIADEYYGRNYVLAAPASEYFDCNPYYKVLETLDTKPPSEWFGHTQHYKTPMAKFLEKLEDFRIEGLVSAGEAYKNHLFDETEKLIDDYKADCEGKFYKDNRERGFFHFQRSTNWYGSKADIDNLINPYRLTQQVEVAAGGKQIYIPDTVVDRTKYDISKNYQPFMHDCPLLASIQLQNIMKDQDLFDNTDPVVKKLVRLKNTLDAMKVSGATQESVKVVAVLRGDRRSASRFSPNQIGDINIGQPKLRPNTIEELNSLKSICDRVKGTLKKDKDECKTLCENDFVEQLCATKGWFNGQFQDGINCADAENLRDSAYSLEILPDRDDRIKGLSITFKRDNSSDNNIKTRLYSDVDGGVDKDGEFVDNDIHTIVAPSENPHQGLLEYERDMTATDFGMRKVYDGLHQTFTPICKTASTVKYHVQDITQDIVSVYDQNNKAEIIEGEIPATVMAQISSTISQSGSTDYVNLQQIAGIKYHEILKANIAAQQVCSPREQVTYKVYLDGASDGAVGSLLTYLKQENGLEGLSIMADEGGYYLDISFSNRPPLNPELEAIFRKAGPIAKSVQPKMSFYRSMS